MIKVKIDKKDEIINHIKISGHALYDDYGKDIVCASVSSIVITSINAIIRIDEKTVSYNKSEGVIEVEILKHNEVTDKIILNMIELLKELSNNYQDNVKIYE